MHLVLQETLKHPMDALFVKFQSVFLMPENKKMALAPKTSIFL